MLTASPIPGAQGSTRSTITKALARYPWANIPASPRFRPSACFIETHGPLGVAVLVETDEDLDRATCLIEEQYLGCYRSAADYAQELTEDCIDMPAMIAPYIDYDALARDMLLNGEIIAVELNLEEVRIFRGY